MQRVVCLALTFAIGALLVGCGGKGADRTPTATVSPQAASETPEVTSYLILEVDSLTLSAAGGLDNVVEEVQGIIRQRAEAMGARLSQIERQGTNQLAFEVSGMTMVEARDTLAGTGLLVFQEPQRDESGKIVCQDAAGQTFTISGETAAYITVDANGDLTQCQSPDGRQTGSVVWKQATGVGDDNVETALTGRFLQANARVIFNPMGLPLVSLAFNSEGGRLFDQITSRLVGFPMAIFLDDDFISAPSVRTPILEGSVVIEGLTADEGRSLSVQLNSGPLPVPLRVIAAGDGPLP